MATVTVWRYYTENRIDTVPIHPEMTLTAKEAAEYSNIGISKIDTIPQKAVIFYQP